MTQAAMRLIGATILAIVTILASAPVHAQTYAPNYPVCLQTYGRDGGYIACGYTSIAQCQASASGRAAQCIVNPYYVGNAPPHRRTRRAYSY
jgi:hypothetical protein